MVGDLSGYWFGSVCVCKCNDWEDLIMAKKNETVADSILDQALKLEKGFYPLANLDYSKYPEIEKFVADFNRVHPHLAHEVKVDTSKYMERLKKAELQLADKLLSRTNQFKEYYEVSSMHFGIVTFYMVLIEMFTIKIEDLQEKLNRYENND